MKQAFKATMPSAQIVRIELVSDPDKMSEFQYHLARSLSKGAPHNIKTLFHGSS